MNSREGDRPVRCKETDSGGEGTDSGRGGNRNIEVKAKVIVSGEKDLNA